MTIWLRQSTSTNVVIGPMSDRADGYTPKTALATVSINLSKNEAGTFAVKNDAANVAHIVNGFYKCGLNATDTNTNGQLFLTADGTSCLPVWHTYMVIPATAFDALVTTIGHFPADVVSITGVSAAISGIVIQALTQYDVPTSADVSAIVSVVANTALVNRQVPTSAAVSTIMAGVLTNADIATSAKVSSVVAGVITNSQVATSAIVSTVVQGALTNYDVPTSADVSAIIAAGAGGVTQQQVSAVVIQALTDFDVPTSADVSSILANAGALSSAAVSGIVAGALVNGTPFKVELISTSAGAIGENAFTPNALNRQADYILTRGVTAVEAASANTVQFGSLLGATGKLVNKVAVSGAVLTIYKADAATTLGVQNLTVNASAAPITGATPT